jgi:uncharacterized protein YodC (DUF2158 family)
MTLLKDTDTGDTKASNAESKIAFAVGDVVRLKSGSPRMVVVDIASDYVTCNWIAYSTNTPQGYPYPIKCVEHDRGSYI